MKGVRRSFFILVCGAIFYLANFAANTSSASERLNMGGVGANPSYVIKRYTPFIQYLKTKGIDTGKILVYKSPTLAVNSLKSGEFGLILNSPVTALKLMDEAGAVPILIGMKGGVKSYNSVLFVRKDSPVHSVSELKGKVIAFETEYSTSSYFLPSNILRKAGLELQYSRKPIPGKIAYYFSLEDVNTVAQVKAGKRAHAGGIQKNYLANHPDSGLFRVLDESVYVPRIVVLVREGINYDKLKKVLVEMQDDPAAQNALGQMNFTGFCEFEGDPAQIMNTSVRKAVEIKHDDF